MSRRLEVVCHTVTSELRILHMDIEQDAFLTTPLVMSDAGPLFFFLNCTTAYKYEKNQYFTPLQKQTLLTQATWSQLE